MTRGVILAQNKHPKNCMVLKRIGKETGFCRGIQEDSFCSLSWAVGSMQKYEEICSSWTMPPPNREFDHDTPGVFHNREPAAFWNSATRLVVCPIKEFPSSGLVATLYTSRFIPAPSTTHVQSAKPRRPQRCLNMYCVLITFGNVLGRSKQNLKFLHHNNPYKNERVGAIYVLYSNADRGAPT